MINSGKQPDVDSVLNYDHWFKPVAGIIGSSGKVQSIFGDRFLKQSNQHASFPVPAAHKDKTGWKVKGNAGIDIGLASEFGAGNHSFVAAFVITPKEFVYGVSLLSTKYNTSINYGALELAIGSDGHPNFSRVGSGNIYDGTSGPALQVGKTSCVIFKWDYPLGAEALQVFVDGRLHGTVSSQGYTLPAYTQCVIGKLAFDDTQRDEFILHGFAYSTRSRHTKEALIKLSANPWQLFVPEDTALYADEAGGGGPHEIAVGITTETDAAVAVGRRKVKTVSAVSESDTALAVVKRKLKVISPAVEVDTALNIVSPAGPITGVVGVTTETDAAQAVAKRKQRTVGLVSEADTAIAIAKRKIKAIGVALETDQALAIRLSGRISPALETDSALSIKAVKRKSIAAASETDVGIAVGKRKYKLLGVVNEIDAALPVVNFGPKKIVVGCAYETDIAMPIIAPAFGGWTHSAAVSGSWTAETPLTGGWAKEAALPSG